MLYDDAIHGTKMKKRTALMRNTPHFAILLLEIKAGQTRLNLILKDIFQVYKNLYVMFN